MNIKKNTGKIFSLFALMILFIANLPGCALKTHFTQTMNEATYDIFIDSKVLYIHFMGLILILFPLSTILMTSDALKKNTTITKERQFIYFIHMIHTFIVSHLINFLLVTFINVHFDKMTNNPISFIMCSFAKYDLATVKKIQCLYYISSATLTSMQYLQHFIVGECTSLSMILSRRIRFIPTNLRVMNDLLFCYFYHVIPLVVMYTVFIIRFYFITDSFAAVFGMLYYSFASSNIAIMISLLIYWVTHGTILTINRRSTTS